MTDPAESSGLPLECAYTRVVHDAQPPQSRVALFAHLVSVASCRADTRHLSDRNQWPGTVPTSITTWDYRPMATRVLANISSGVPVLLTDKELFVYIDLLTLFSL